MFLPFNFISIQAQSYGMSAIAASYLVVALNTARRASRIILTLVRANNPIVFLAVFYKDMLLIMSDGSTL
jgi:hypothetical protein